MAEGDQNTQPVEQQQQQPASQWQYNTDVAGTGATAPAPLPESVEWSASEFIEHDKGFSWYLLLAVIGLLVAATIYIITRDMVSAVVVCLFAIILGVAGARKPRVVAYRLDDRGLSAGNKFHPYSDFKSFALIEEGAFSSIALLPVKRISLPVSLYIAPNDEQRIMDAIGKHLPMQQGEMSLTDSLLRRMHF